MKWLSSLNKRLYLALAIIVLFYAFLVIITNYFFQHITQAHEQFVQDGSISSIQEFRQLTTEAVHQTESWILLKDSEYNLQNALVWNRKFGETKVKLLAITKQDTVHRLEPIVQYILTEQAKLESAYHDIEALLPTIRSFKDTAAISQAQKILVLRLLPAAKEIESSLTLLQSEYQKVLARKQSEFRLIAYRFDQILFGSVIVFGVFILYIGYYLIRLILKPIYELNVYLSLLALGEIPNDELEESNHELGLVAKAANTIAQNLRKAVEFTNRIGQGNFKTRFELVSEEDVLGKALITMRDRLRNYSDLEQKRNWMISGLNLFDDIFRKNQDLKTLTDETISRLTKYVHANQGTIFLLNTNYPEPILELVSSYAYNKKKIAHRTYKLGEGFIGQAARELEPIYITEIPESYTTLSSAFGDAAPSSLLVVPIVNKESLFGVIELASFNRFQQEEIEFVKKLSDSLGAMIGNIQVNTRNLQLLEQSRKMGEELKNQSEQLKQSAETMALQQLELQKVNEQLDQQLRALNKTTQELQRSERKFWILLENASEIITIYERDGSVRFLSPSVTRILGYKPDDLTGLAIYKHIHPEDMPKVKQFFSDLIKFPHQQQTVEYRYKKANGGIIYLESIGTNLSHDPNINGIVTNTRDITERRRADQNARRKLQFQSLSENSPDLIIRFDLKGRYLYINPIVEKYSGSPPDAFVKNTIYSVGLSSHVIQFWENVIKAVSTTGQKLSTEFIFPTIIGERIMQVEVIPETNIDGVIETVFSISHDITEIRQAEQQIRVQNQKLEQQNLEILRQKQEIEIINHELTDSLRYAKRIQGTILPEKSVLDKHFQDYFIFYRPKDIVSGDFYWFSAIQDKLLFAVVDCTGHGVPGAFMSLIGYTLLNQIVNEQDTYEPAQVLRKLHLGVREALKQSEHDFSSRDGMDLTFCCYHSSTKILEFAAAMRTLYYLSGDKMEEIKGDKTSIGGTQFETERLFTNHRIEIQSGDSIVLSTDGYADQFGGPDGKKLSTKRFRETLYQSRHLPMFQIGQILEETLSNWQKDTPQVDDIAIMGIRF